MTVMINEVGLVLLLRVAWIAATLPILIASIPVSALNRFHAAMLGFAKRGKIMNHQSPSCNVSFYTAAPLSLCSFCAPELLRYAAYLFVEFIVKGRDRVAAFEFDWWGYVKPLTKLGFCQWVGVAIFVWGWIHQYRCHAILGSLRDHKEEATEYAIPRGDWFEIVSSPHYLAEIVIYAGILVASGGSDLTIWLLFTFVVSNLVFAAAETQRWYLCKFDNYPVSRRAILPFLY
ncbi:polyprenol reductase 2-like isoform X2 [Magnolia sinica]|uniref:polyprenol reductase 2-like isoform X2 n=1 Tax=Magnolia sinica TaxID=86752 RepID=UPI002657D3C8|nr:polyprenol reductase 2-like isoform X2 [Magnolia sinica]